MRELLSRMKNESENSSNKRNKHKDALTEEVNEASVQLKVASQESIQNSSSSFLTIFQKTRESSVGVLLR